MAAQFQQAAEKSFRGLQLGAGAGVKSCMENGNHNHGDDNFENGDRVWKLLGAARPVPVRPMFAADVMRRIRAESPRVGEGWRGFFRFAFPAFAACALAVALLLAGIPGDRPGETGEGGVVSRIAGDTGGVSVAEFVEAAGLDGLVSASAGWEWDSVAPGFP